MRQRVSLEPHVCMRNSFSVAVGCLCFISVFLPVIIVATPAEATAPSRMADGAYRVMVPLVLRNASVGTGCGEGHSCPVLVRTEGQDGSPIAGARVVGLYHDDAGRTHSETGITDEKGEVTLPGSPYPIIFEIQFPIGIVPCPSSSPRMQVEPRTDVVTFVGCPA